MFPGVKNTGEFFRGVAVRIIYVGSLNQYETLVDDCDYDFLIQWRWTFKRSSHRYDDRIYARRCIRIAAKK